MNANLPPPLTDPSIQTVDSKSCLSELLLKPSSSILEIYFHYVGQIPFKKKTIYLKKKIHWFLEVKWIFTRNWKKGTLKIRATEHQIKAP